MVHLAADLVAGHYILVTGYYAIADHYAFADPYESGLIV